MEVEGSLVWVEGRLNRGGGSRSLHESGLVFGLCHDMVCQFWGISKPFIDDDIESVDLNEE